MTPTQRLPAFWLNAPSLVWSVSPGRIPTAIFAAQTGGHVLDNGCVDHAAWRMVLLGYGSNSWPRKHPFLGLVAIKPYCRAPPAVSAMSLQCLCVKKATGNPLRLGAPGIQQMKVAPHRSCTDMQPPFTGLSLLNCSWHHVPVGKVERYWQYWRIIVLQIANESTIL